MQRWRAKLPTVFRSQALPNFVWGESKDTNEVIDCRWLQHPWFKHTSTSRQVLKGWSCVAQLCREYCQHQVSGTGSCTACWRCYPCDHWCLLTHFSALLHLPSISFADPTVAFATAQPPVLSAGSLQLQEGLAINKQSGAGESVWAPQLSSVKETGYAIISYVLPCLILI